MLDLQQHSSAVTLWSWRPSHYYVVRTAHGNHHVPIVSPTVIPLVTGKRSMKRVLASVCTLALILLASVATAQQSASDVGYQPDVRFTLRTDIADGKLVYISEAGPTKGQVNPDL